jgi:hypothetical protein
MPPNVAAALNRYCAIVNLPLPPHFTSRAMTERSLSTESL